MTVVKDINRRRFKSKIRISFENNENYLHADFYGNYSYAGTPFADNNCTRDSDNILLYGHKLRDGSVYHSLLNDGEKAYWQGHPTIMFSDLYADYEYEVMAAFYDRVYSSEEPGFRYYQFTDAADEEEFNYAFNKYKEKSLYDTRGSCKLRRQTHYPEYLRLYSKTSADKMVENVCAREVEDVLREHPAVFGCALMGVEDQRFGEAVAAAIVLNPGASLSDEELIAYCRRSLPSDKKPRYAAFMDALPHNVTGQIKKSVLREHAGELFRPIRGL